MLAKTTTIGAEVSEMHGEDIMLTYSRRKPLLPMKDEPSGRVMICMQINLQ